MRAVRRAQIILAFADVLAEHGYAGATMAAVAERAGVAPGLIHHHFEGKADLLDGLLDVLITRFRQRAQALETGADPLAAYGAAALRLDAEADAVAARCWVGLFAEAIREPALFARVRRLVDAEIEGLRRRSSERLSAQGAGAVLAFVIGALVLGAFAPRKTAGFAAPALQALIEALGSGRGGPLSSGGAPSAPPRSRSRGAA